ncbi:IS630 family transposase [Microvirga pakistanensis]|uniref:IS630 family transposase n=1 Tax=Microvirga pakistanensis TaxID=1682650 RepID=UPI001FCE9AE2|nr:IS630 family transposase [Microvirga pakistanensis]
MFSDPEQWARIRYRVLVEGVSRSQVARETGVSMNMVRKMLREKQPVAYGPREQVFPKLGPYLQTVRDMVLGAEPPMLSCREVYRSIRQQGFTGGYDTVRNYIRSLKPTDRMLWEATYDQIGPLDRKSAVDLLMRVAKRCRDNERQSLISSRGCKTPKELTRQAVFTWLRELLQHKMPAPALRCELGEVPDLDGLLERLHDGNRHTRNRSLVILGSLRGWPSTAICAFLGIETKTYRGYCQAYERGGAAALFAPRAPTRKKINSDALKSLIFTILHEPPLTYGIHRTAWTLGTLQQVLAAKGSPACRDTIRTITHRAGWRWRKARKVLTSTDPDYSEKVRTLRSTLAALQADEAFFSIDEFGPFIVRRQGGRALTPPGTVRTIPARQKARGTLILTAALELATNQVTHIYSANKNTAEMIRLIEILATQYAACRQLYLSWDAASWHSSNQLKDWLAKYNADAQVGGGPQIRVVPLPSCAPFLNVIEAVFSGMARAVLHNSDYPSAEEAQAAIDRYLAERNAHFQAHPERAGEWVWGLERQPAVFSEASTCKDPAYR